MTTDTFGNFIEQRHDVERSAALLKRLYLVERELMRALAAKHIAIENWTAKNIMPRHWWVASLHADDLRERVLELRYPRRDVDRDHDPNLTAFLAELTKGEADTEFLVGIYRVLRPALAAACREYLAEADPIADAPSIYKLEHILFDIERAAAEDGELLASLDPAEVEAAQPWVDYLTAFMNAMGGILGEGPQADLPLDHPCAGRETWVVPEKCVRPREFHPARVESPGRPPENHREQQVWYGIDHANEVWAAEAPAAFLWQMPKMPWNFFTDVARWSYDEMRHAQLGARRLDAWGFQMGVDYPMVGDPVDAIYEKGGGPLEILALLYYFEKDAPAHRMVTKKEFGAMDDSDTAIDTDYDWADEAIHLKYGFTWLQHIVGADKPDELKALVERAGEMWNTWLAERWENGEDLYGPYMERIEARIHEAASAADVAQGAAAR
ncbi:MAG TPA: DUF455 family protein [Thermomicrobiales bacterium]|nr:DUF455 family protein [Thermomicrobiales bacterium]